MKIVRSIDDLGRELDNLLENVDTYPTSPIIPTILITDWRGYKTLVNDILDNHNILGSYWCFEKLPRLNYFNDVSTPFLNTKVPIYLEAVAGQMREGDNVFLLKL